MAGPLQNVKVIELAHWVAVPSASAILADWGAEVIKVEEPVRGDPTRGIRSIEGVSTFERGVQVLWENRNRGKRNITVDLKNKRGKEIIYKLAGKSDVVVTNFERTQLERFEIGYEALSRLNPRLVYAHLTGYGEKGPDRGKPGYDYSAFWARSGIMAKVAEEGSPPQPQRPGLGDNITSMLIAGAVAAALFARERTGAGQEVSFSLYHTGVWALSEDIIMPLARGVEMPNTNRNSVRNPLWNTYQTKDGRYLQLVMVQSDLFWSRFCQAMGIEHLEHDSKYEDSLKREENNRSLISIINDIFRTKTVEEWEKIYEEHNLVCGRVQTALEVANDPQAWDNSFFAEVEHPVIGSVRMVNSPAVFSETPASIGGLGGQFNQHTEEVLLELGYTWEDISRLKDEHVIG